MSLSCKSCHIVMAACKLGPAAVLLLIGLPLSQVCQTRAGMSLLLLELALDRMHPLPLLLMSGVLPPLLALQVSQASALSYLH